MRSLRTLSSSTSSDPKRARLITRRPTARRPMANAPMATAPNAAAPGAIAIRLVAGAALNGLVTSRAICDLFRFDGTLSPERAVEGNRGGGSLVPRRAPDGALRRERG